MSGFKNRLYVVISSSPPGMRRSDVTYGRVKYETIAVLTRDVVTAMPARDMRATVGRLDSMIKKNGEMAVVAPSDDRDRIFSRRKVGVSGP